jgi:phage head maturation protease
MSDDAVHATILSDADWDSKSGTERELSMEIRIQSPFKVDKNQKMGDNDEYEMADNDVVIRGPVYVGDDNMLDRHSELVDMKAIFSAWEAYSQNPVILYNHSKTNGVIGRMTDVEMGTWDGIEGDVPVGRAIIDGGEEAIVRKIRKGFLRAFSIGFIAKAAVKECKDDDTCYIKFTEIEWLETSVVDVPASPNALFSVEKHILGYEDMGDRIAVLFAKPDEDESTPADDEVAVDIEADKSAGKSCGCGESCNCGETCTCGETKSTDPDESEESEEVSPIGTFELGENDTLDARLSLIEAFIDAMESKSSDSDSFNTPLEQPIGYPDTEMNDMTDQEIIKASEESEELVEEVLEESLEVLEEAPAEELVEESLEESEEKVELSAEATEEESADEPMVVKATDELLFGIVQTLSNIDSRIADLENKFATPDLSGEVAELKSIIEERDATIASLTEEKKAAEAEAAIEAEVSKRVAERVGAPIPTTKNAAPKSLVPSVEPTVKTGTTKFDPVPEVSNGMNGLAAWLQNQIERRGA